MSAMVPWWTIIIFLLAVWNTAGWLIRAHHNHPLTGRSFLFALALWGVFIWSVMA